MVNSAAVSFRFRAIVSIPTFNSRHRATCTGCRIFRSLAQLPCHGRPRCCPRSDFLVPLLEVRHSVVLNKAFSLIIGTASHRSCSIPHFVVFGSEYPWAQHIDFMRCGLPCACMFAQALQCNFLRDRGRTRVSHVGAFLLCFRCPAPAGACLLPRSDGEAGIT